MRRHHRVLRSTTVFALTAAVAAAVTVTAMHGVGTPGWAATTCATVRPQTPNSPTSAKNPLLNTLAGVKELSYYPADAAWTELWDRWDPARIEQDLCGIAGLGANTVRIIVQPAAFGFPSPDRSTLDHLSATVALASRYGVTVQLTLFDWWHDYTDIAGSDIWMRTILQPFRGDPNIGFIELQNEIDPDSAPAMSWARHELISARADAPGIPVTVSITGSDLTAQLARLKDALGATQPDFYDVHYYGYAGAAFATFSALRATASPLPLFIGETGASSEAANSPSGDARQDLYLRTVEWAARAADLPPAAPWMYSDLLPAAIPPGATVEEPQRYYGLVRTDGTPKLSAASIRALYSGLPLTTTFNGAFTTGHDGLPDDWWPSPDTPGTKGSPAWDSSYGHTAPGSVRLSKTGGEPSQLPALITIPVLQPTYPGQQFRLDAWAMGATATGTNRIAISWFTASGAFVREDDSPPLPQGTTTWTPLSVTAQTPASAAYAEIRLQSAANSGTVWFDDVSFTALD